MTLSFGTYGEADVIALLRDLTLIQQVKNIGDRINTYNKTIQSASLITSVSRTMYYTNECRETTIKFIENKLTQAYDLVFNYIPTHGIDKSPEINQTYVEEIIKNIKRCRKGIMALKETTYTGDISASTRLHVIILKLDEHVQKYERLKKNLWKTKPIRIKLDKQVQISMPKSSPPASPGRYPVAREGNPGSLQQSALF